MTKQSFIKGAMILLIAGVLNRILGFIPRITLPRIIGAEGVGIYQLSYPFLIVLLTFITGGIPLAIAKWIAEAQSVGDERRVKQIFRTAMFLSVSIALFLTSIMLLFAPVFIKYVIPDPRVYQSFLMMSPLLLIVGISAVYRGYFQGKQNMIPSAVSQTVETLIRIVFSLVLAYWLLPYGLAWGAAGAMLGVVMGEIGGLAVMLLSHVRDKKKPITIAAELPLTSENEFNNAVVSKEIASKSILAKLLTLSIPVTGSKLVGSLSYLLESIFTARSLAAAGIITGIATAQYGALQGMIMPLILLPTALTYSLAVSLVPSLSEAVAQKQYHLIHKRLHQSMRISLVAGAPFTIIMFIFAAPICELLYAHGEYAPLLQLIAPIGIFIYLQAPLQATLQALEKPGVALMNTFIGAIIKIALIIILGSNPQLGIKGVLIAIAINTVLVTLLHSYSVKRYVGFKMHMMDFVKVGASIIITGGFAQYVMSLLANQPLGISLPTACMAAMIVYIFLMFLTKIIDKADLIRIPYIGKWFGSDQ
ncbi:stage V sporulation protein B [Paenibacillus endoradicis]|uniref:stage V sporulation protein B n=1 Tax=Paenibacillus endoradicis TaxID=2972487 RepID=UPI002158E10E|nr:stage V sporulation protein B [Paenibacillus endoradicis]MCR8655742.1 stage V sporulation protein B [Paenibacillus endoradicis]MCR8658068.1 stage V sporulation protein B [Paenibacillus endoradicis]